MQPDSLKKWDTSHLQHTITTQEWKLPHYNNIHLPKTQQKPSIVTNSYNRASFVTEKWQCKSYSLSKAQFQQSVKYTRFQEAASIRNFSTCLTGFSSQ
jgi:hypothetical protein